MNLIKKNQKFVFLDTAQKVFKKLKDVFIRAFFLIYFKPELLYYMESDFNRSAIVGIIF